MPQENEDPNTPPEGTPKPPEAGDVDSLPQWARDAITKANREAAGFRTKVKELEPLAAKAQELEDADRSEVDKAAKRVADAEAKAQAAELKAMRLEVAADKGLSTAQAKRLVGATIEELTADADELLETFAPAPGESSTPPLPGKPREQLKPGNGDPEAPPDVDFDKLAADTLSTG